MGYRHVLLEVGVPLVDHGAEGALPHLLGALSHVTARAPGGHRHEVSGQLHVEVMAETRRLHVIVLRVIVTPHIVPEVEAELVAVLGHADRLADRAGRLDPCEAAAQAVILGLVLDVKGLGVIEGFMALGACEVEVSITGGQPLVSLCLGGDLHPRRPVLALD